MEETPNNLEIYARALRKLNTALAFYGCSAEEVRSLDIQPAINGGEVHAAKDVVAIRVTICVPVEEV